MHRYAPRLLNRTVAIVFLPACLMLFTPLYTRPLFADRQEHIFTPDSGMEFADDSKDLDIEYVPSRMEAVHEMLKLGNVSANDFLIDLGSGDGRIVITAAKQYGARGLGIDLNRKLVELSKKNAAKVGVSNLADFRVQDFFKTDIARANIITLYVLTELNLKLRPKLLDELNPGTRIVSQAGHMGDWRPDKTVMLDIAIKDRKKVFLYLWTVPAKIDGKWRWDLPVIKDVPLLFFRNPHILELKQKFQDIRGAVINQKQSWQIFNTHLNGGRIRFSVASEAADDRIIRQDYLGTVNKNVIHGTVTLSGATRTVTKKWRAIR